jgi:hypothetical protein
MGQNRPAPLSHPMHLGLAHRKPFINRRLGNHGGHGKYPLPADPGKNHIALHTVFLHFWGRIASIRNTVYLRMEVNEKWRFDKRLSLVYHYYYQISKEYTFLRTPWGNKMTNTKLRLGTLVMVFTFGMMVMVLGAGCQPEPDNNPSLPAARGKMTIIGLDDFNGKYVYVQGLISDGTLLIGLTDIIVHSDDITYKLARISGDKAKVPLYVANSSATSNENSYIAYMLNDTIKSINILILDTDSLRSSNMASAINNNSGKKTITSGKFTEGNITLDWETGFWAPPDVNASDIIQLVENSWSDIRTFPVVNDKYIHHWFTFKSTASIQYIHFKFTNDNRYIGFVVYDNDGIKKYESKYGDFSNGPLYELCSHLIPDQKYYIKTYPTFTLDVEYQIAFNSSDTPPQ